MSYLRHLKHVWTWNKYFYFFSLAFTGLAGILYYSKIASLEIITYPLMMFSLCFTFLSFQKDHFSIKYLQSLPLTRRELYHLKLGDTLISIIPLFFWAFVFQGVVLEIFSEGSVLGLESSLMLLAFFLLFAFLVSIWSFFRLYEMSRSPFVKGNPKTYNYQMLKITVFYFTCGLYALYAFVTSIHLFHKYFPKFLLMVGDYLGPLKSTWSLLGILAVLVWFEYHRVFRRWLDESRSYIKYNWKPLRDVPLMFLALFAVILPPAYVVHNQEPDYGKSDLIEVVQSGQIDEVRKVLDHGVDINSKTSMGYTALMAAAQLGNEKMYFYLLSRGASKEGIVSRAHKYFAQKNLSWLAVYGGNEAIVRDIVDSKNVNSLHDGSSLLHVAARSCHERIIDHLLELGADPGIKVTGKKGPGKTPLHFATVANCLNGVISLVEAGASLSERDGTGKLAVDYVRGRNKDLKYYLERKSRSPAGTK